MLTNKQKDKTVIAIQGVLIGVVLEITIAATTPAIIGLGIVSLLYITSITVKRIMKNDTNSYS